MNRKCICERRLAAYYTEDLIRSIYSRSSREFLPLGDLYPFSPEHFRAQSGIVQKCLCSFLLFLYYSKKMLMYVTRYSHNSLFASFPVTSYFAFFYYSLFEPFRFICINRCFNSSFTLFFTRFNRRCTLVS